MAVTAQNPVITYTASGSATEFPYPYLILVSSDVAVYVDGVLTVSGYSVDGVGDIGGGDVTFTVPPTAGASVKLLRAIPRTRATDYTEGGALRADTLNDDIDRVVLMLQDVRADSPSLIEFEGIVISVENNAEAAEASATAAAASAAASLASADIAEEAAAEALATSAATAAAAADAAAISASAAASAASAASSASASASASAAAGSAAAAAASASIMDPATATPLQTSGAGVVGTAVKYAREDHAHPELATSSVTETKLATAVKPIGVGQTWQVVTGSRALSTTYTNSTGRPIQVAVTTIGTANGSSTQLYFDVNGVTVHRSGTVLGAGGAVAGPNVCLVVPDGATYAVTTSQGAIAIWAELR